MKNERGTRGKTRQDASFPVAPGKADLPPAYQGLLQEIKARVQHTRLQAVLTANAALVNLYWEIGQSILQRQHQEGWGTKVIDRLAHDLRGAFPDMQGFSPRNLLFMRAFAQFYPDAIKVKQLVSQVPWGHIILLMQRVKDADACDWYMEQCLQYGWSRAILAIQIDRQAYTRDLNKPIGVAQWETRITQSLPTELASCLPTIAEIEAELQGDAGKGDE